MSNKRKSGLADSPFFTQTKTVESKNKPNSEGTIYTDKQKVGIGAESKLTNIDDDTTTPRHRDTTVSRDHDTMNLAVDLAEIEMIRQAVKKIGREGGTFRFSEEEKNLLNQAIFDYVRDHNIRTSGNEITRIAVNFIFQEYEKNGTDSILHKVLIALHT